MNELKVGDRIYGLNSKIITGIHTVDRVTKTQAITNKNSRFRKIIDKNGYVDLIGADKWSRNIYKIETEELKTRLRIQYLVKKLSGFNFSELPMEKLEKVWNIIEVEDTNE